MHSGIGGLAHALAAVAATRVWTPEESALAAAIGERLRAVTQAATMSPTSTGWSAISRPWSCWSCWARRPASPGCSSSPRRVARQERRHSRDRCDRPRRAHGDRGGVRARGRARRVRRRPTPGRGGGDAGRPELALRPASACPTRQARRRPPGRDAQLVARAGRDRRRARPGRGRPVPARPGRGLSTRRRAPGHAGRLGLAGRRRPRRTPLGSRTSRTWTSTRGTGATARPACCRSSNARRGRRR